jgi:hypothetical protein
MRAFTCCNGEERDMQEEMLRRDRWSISGVSGCGQRGEGRQTCWREHRGSTDKGGRDMKERRGEGEYASNRGGDVFVRLFCADRIDSEEKGKSLCLST